MDMYKEGYEVFAHGLKILDWLCDNVDGAIPPYELLSEKARSIVELQGIYRDRIPPKKEGILL